VALKDLFNNLFNKYTSQPASPSPSRPSIPPVTNYSNKKTTTTTPTAANYYQSQARATGAPVSPTYYQSQTRATGAQKPVTFTPKTSTPSGFTGGTLSRGSKGDDVRLLQQILGIPVDGSFGAQTEAAVRAFQKANGLVVDGRVGPATKAALLGGSAPKSSSSSGSKSSGSSGSVSAPKVSAPKASAPTPSEFQAPEPPPEFSFNEVAPEFQFDGQMQETPSLEELIALAAQQLDPQYQIIRSQSEDINKKILQDIENDSIRRGRFYSSYAANRQDAQNQEFQKYLQDLDVQKQAQANEMGREDYRYRQDLARQDYERAYREAMDAYARAWDAYQDSYNKQWSQYQDKYGRYQDAYQQAWNKYQDDWQRSQAAFQNEMERQRLALEQQLAKWQMSQPRGGSSSGGSGGLSNQEINLFNSSVLKASQTIAQVKNKEVTPNEAIQYLQTGLRGVENGIYSEEFKKQSRQITDNAIAEIRKLQQPAPNAARFGEFQRLYNR
jgi:hypothetical protein